MLKLAVMPDREGEDLVREIRSICPSLPIIIASGQAKDHLADFSRTLNSISFVAKLYTAEQPRGALRDGGISSAGGSARAQSHT